nr:uncharacterized protein LOC111503399 [Leptinotarsa decemlineata]
MVKDASKNKTQKLIIPKGTIDSTDTTIIEIPVKLHSQPVVVAKRKTSEKSLFLDGNREAITFRPHHTLLEPESFTEFNEKIVGHQSTMLEDNRPRGAQVSRTGFSDGFHQRPVFRDPYPEPPTRPYTQPPGDIRQQPFQRQRPGLLSTQDLCEIATQFREARKKLDRVIAQASQEADCSSGNTLQPCLKHNRPDNGSESKPHSNVQKQSKPRELDPLLVSRELQTGTRDRPLERRRSNRGEEVRYEREMQTVERRRSKNDDFDEFRCAAGGTSTPIPSKRTQQVDAVDSADSLLGDDEPEGKIVTDNLMDDKLPKKSSKSSSAFRDREEEPNVQDRAKKFTPLTETPTMLAPQEIVKRSSLSSKSRISSVTAEDDEDEVRDNRQSRVETKPQEQARSSKSSRFQTSQYADDDNDDAEDIRKSGFETRVSYRPTPKKSDCATCCRLIGDFPEMNSVTSIIPSEELKEIRRQFQEATKTLQQALSALPSSGFCQSSSGTFPCEKSS